MVLDTNIPTAGLAADDSRDAALIAELERYVPEVMRVTGTPGLNLALARGDRVIWEAGFGYADLAAATPMTPRTVGRAGSMAKTYTAIAFLQLVELGVLELFDPVVRHLPAPRVVNPLGEREITIYDLLTFHSGLVRDTLEARAAPIDPDAYVEQSLREDARREYGGASSRWSARVGEQSQYSSFGYAILARLFKEVSPGGASLGEWVARHVFEPLGMTSSALPEVDDEQHVPEHVRARRSTGYARFGSVYVPCPTLYTGSYAGSGLQTTPGDHLRVLRALAGGGAIDGQRILEPESVRRMLTVQRFADEAERRWGAVTQQGIGVEIGNVGRADQHFGRNGAYPWGWWSSARVYPRQGFAIAVMTNKWDMSGWMNPDSRTAGGLIADFTSALMRRTASRPPAERTWGWRHSYAVGLLMGERIAALLGVPERLDAATIARMAAEARVLLAPADDESWDEDGFRAGVEEIAACDPSPAALRAFQRSDVLRVAPEELQLHWLAIGSHGRSPIPLGFYAAAVEEAERAGR